MDLNEADKENWKALRRIVALLLSLAALAECASLRSRPVRALVLWLLRPAEDIARDYVYGLTGTAFPPAPKTFLHDGDGPDDAMRMALSFRTLALALAALTDEALASCGAGVQILCTSLARSISGALASRGDLRAALAVERRDSS